MQTFVPFPNVHQCARVLDRQRLGKQRLEARHIVNVLEGRAHGWERTSVVRMWRGYEDALKTYYNAICHEWERRGYRHNMGYYDVPAVVQFPPWWGDDTVHYSHRSKLYQKDPRYYFGWTGIAPVGYVWPRQGEN